MRDGFGVYVVRRLMLLPGKTLEPAKLTVLVKILWRLRHHQSELLVTGFEEVRGRGVRAPEGK